VTARVKVRRDGPGEWSWTLQDEHSDLITGVAASWRVAIAEATEELQLLAEADQPPAFEIPIIKFDATAAPRAYDWTDYVPDAVAMRARPAPWRRWLGL
jgi:hypothetical protein